MINGLNQLHERNAIHRDLKPENSFLSIYGDSSNLLNIIAKIGDFGVARKLSSQEVKSQTYYRGTLDYFSPERLSGNPYD